MFKKWLPPVLVPLLRRFSLKSIKFKGDYPSWNEASLRAIGYEHPGILERALASALKIRDGKAAFERDSILFDEVHYDWPVTAALMWVVARSRGVLRVLDYGGALGSSFFQHREFIKNVDVLWSIVEQKNFVAAGKEFLEEERLRFFEGIKECCAETHPNVALISSALQYIEDPYEVIRQIETTPADILVLNRTPFFDGQNDRICIQHVPSSIYIASYPVWIFSRKSFLSKLNGWSLVATFESDEGTYLLDDLKCVRFLGFILERRNAQ